MNKVKKLEYEINRLKNRIHKHRRNCKGWQNMKPCLDCHLNTLTRIENALEEVKDKIMEVK